MSKTKQTINLVILIILFFILAFFTFSLNKPEAILLSFDVEPVDSDNSVLEILDILEKEDIAATFFITGEYAEQYPQIVKQIAANNKFEIASHSYSHKNLKKLSRFDKIFEIEESKLILEDLTNSTVFGFRAPYNRLDFESLEIVKANYVYDASLILQYPPYFDDDFPEVRVASFILPIEDVIFLYYLKAPSVYFWILKNPKDRINSYLFHPHHIVQHKEDFVLFINHLKMRNITFINHRDLILYNNG